MYHIVGIAISNLILKLKILMYSESFYLLEALKLSYYFSCLTFLIDVLWCEHIKVWYAKFLLGTVCPEVAAPSSEDVSCIFSPVLCLGFLFLRYFYNSDVVPSGLAF